MNDIYYPPLGDLVFDESYFGPSSLARMSAEMRLYCDCGYHVDEATGYAQASLWDSFRETWLSILELPVPTRDVSA